jgi:hypothetical protein
VNRHVAVVCIRTAAPALSAGSARASSDPAPGRVMVVRACETLDNLDLVARTPSIPQRIGDEPAGLHESQKTINVATVIAREPIPRAYSVRALISDALLPLAHPTAIPQNSSVT